MERSGRGGTDFRDLLRRSSGGSNGHRSRTVDLGDCQEEQLLGQAVQPEPRRRFYNPNKFADDDDVSDMEAGFEDIQREEMRSTKIAR
ncbi:hypothetical protein ABKV19_003897 [Rosa sericea]